MKLSNRQILLVMHAIIVINLLSGCNNGVSFTRLGVDTNCLYYDVSDPYKRPYTGKAYSTFPGYSQEDYANKIATIYRIENGIVKGDYVEYAPAGEVFQKGDVTPVIPSEDIKKLFPSIKRLSLITTDYKMPYSEFEILVVASQPAIDSIDLSYKRDAVINFLISKGMLNEKDAGHIMFFGVVSSELLLADPK